MLTENERNLLVVLEFAIATRTPPEDVAIALQQLRAQLPLASAAAADDRIHDSVRRRDFIEAQKGPRSKNHGLNPHLINVPRQPPETPERRAFIEKMKRPTPLPPRETR